LPPTVSVNCDCPECRIASQDARRCRLLQEAHEDSPEVDWRNWAAGLGPPLDVDAKIVRYSTFSHAIGAALGGSPLIDPELTSGRLVRLSPGLSRPASWRFVLRRGPSRLHPMREALIDFLRKGAGYAGPP
jgi:DNA-binding transcriptional LysR family regulator